MNRNNGGKPSFSAVIISIAAILLLAGLGMFSLSRVMSGRQKNKIEESISMQSSQTPSQEASEGQGEKTTSPVLEVQAEKSREAQTDSIPEIIDSKPKTPVPDTPELPDVVGLSYEETEDKIISVDSAPELQFQFNEKYNKGCILDLSWQEDQLVVSISAGRDSGFYCMRKEFADGSIDYVDVYYTDQWGRHTQAYKYDSNGGVIYSFEFEYNDCGQEIGQNFYLPDGSFHHSWTFEYDLYGRLTAEYKYDGNGSELSHSEFSYNSKGKLKEKKDYMNGGLAYVWKMNNYDSDATPLTYYTHMYGNWTDATIANGSGAVIRSGKQSFDSDGNVKSYEIYEKNGQLAYQYVFESAPIAEINDLSDEIRSS